MVGAVDGLADRQGPLDGVSGAGKVPEVLEDAAQVVHIGCHSEVVGAVDGLADRQGPLQRHLGARELRPAPKVDAGPV